jgi:hypothetical protein
MSHIAIILVVFWAWWKPRLPSVGEGIYHNGLVGFSIILLHLFIASRRIFGGERVPLYTINQAGIIGRCLMIFKVGLFLLGVLPDILRGIPPLTLLGCSLEPIKHGYSSRASFVRLAWWCRMVMRNGVLYRFNSNFNYPALRLISDGSHRCDMWYLAVKVLGRASAAF